MDEADRDAYLATLVPYADLDHRGTTFTDHLLRDLLNALRETTNGFPCLGRARFDEAYFGGDADFGEALFADDARFDRAVFLGNARFDSVTFRGDACFREVSFAQGAGFSSAAMESRAWFVGARFETASRLGPMLCRTDVVLDSAVFGAPVTVQIVSDTVTCVGTRWISTARMHLRYAEVDLTDAVLEYPLTVSARRRPFPVRSGVTEPNLGDKAPDVFLTSVDGVDAAQLVLNDIDLSVCQFAGAIHLDQLRVDGWCTFASTPAHTRRYPPSLRLWTARQTLAEEHHWRSQAARTARARGWTPPPDNVASLQPAALASLYRQLRKSLEDGKNEPDAADFYYGEMEMRRHDRRRPPAERGLLTAYWALSGYGLRALRVLAWLGVAMAATVVALLLWGLPTDDPKPETTGRQVAVGQDIRLTTDTPDPVNPTGPWTERLNTERFERALRVVINSVVFRSSGQDLTTAGTYTEMASRITEPILLGLAILAIRNRVKR
ncbi:pentapeptide repeat-containing protein [Streptomyces massasporeus]|uniref:pentapeptide repeat-containing protein n=1 Tax=Streptomyces massasporeus TaxID=67324 RepID=UPI00381812C1